MDLKEKSSKLLADSITGVFAAALSKVFILLKMDKSAETAVEEYYQKVADTGQEEPKESNPDNHPDTEVTSAGGENNG